MDYIYIYIYIYVQYINEISNYFKKCYCKAVVSLILYVYVFIYLFSQTVKRDLQALSANHDIELKGISND